MEMVAKLVRKYRLARLCRIGVWIVVIAGAAQIAASIYSTWATYHQNQIGMSMNQGWEMFVYNQTYTSPVYIFFQFTGPLFSTVALYVFYGIVLYVASVIFQAISAQPATASVTSQSESTSELDGAEGEEDPDRIVYTSLKSTDIARDRQQISNHKSAGHRS